MAEPAAATARPAVSAERPKPPRRILAFTKYGPLAASTRQRFNQYEPFLRGAGFEVEYAPLLGNDHLERIVRGKRSAAAATFLAYTKRLRALLETRSYDLIWVHYEMFPYLPAVFEKLVFRSGKPVLVDYDDATFATYQNSTRPWVRRLLGKKLEPLMSRADAICCGSRHILEYAQRHCARSIFLPTVVDTTQYRPALRAPGESLKIGWIGSPSTWSYVIPFLPSLGAAAARNGARIQVVGAGDQATADGVGQVDFRRWSEEREIAEVQDFDVGIMPLPDDPWSRGKCGYKLVQYMACGVPVVASPVGANNDIVTDGAHGFFAETPQEWENALDRLLSDSGLRATMGAAGRARVEREYSLAVTGPKLVSIIRDLVG